MKSKELKTYNLPSEDLLMARIDAKPTILFVLLLLFGLLSFLLDIPSIYGTILILFALFGMAYMPRVVLIEFYKDYLVLYNKADRETCVLIYYEDIASWYYSWGANRDYLYIELADGNTEKIEGFSKTLFESNMNRFLKDKHRKMNK